VRPLVIAEQSDRPLNQLIAYSPFEPANIWAICRGPKSVMLSWKGYLSYTPRQLDSYTSPNHRRLQVLSALGERLIGIKHHIKNHQISLLAPWMRC